MTGTACTAARATAARQCAAAAPGAFFPAGATGIYSYSGQTPLSITGTAAIGPRRASHRKGWPGVFVGTAPRRDVWQHLPFPQRFAGVVDRLHQVIEHGLLPGADIHRGDHAGHDGKARADLIDQSITIGADEHPVIHAVRFGFVTNGIWRDQRYLAVETAIHRVVIGGDLHLGRLAGVDEGDIAG